LTAALLANSALGGKERFSWRMDSIVGWVMGAVGRFTKSVGAQ
jgi:hypothetical protein